MKKSLCFILLHSLTLTVTCSEILHRPDGLAFFQDKINLNQYFVTPSSGLNQSCCAMHQSRFMLMSDKVYHCGSKLNSRKSQFGILLRFKLMNTRAYNAKYILYLGAQVGSKVPQKLRTPVKSKRNSANICCSTCDIYLIQGKM